jgi:hypothetical protein
MKAVTERHEASVDVLKHSSTGVVEVVRIEYGKAIQDRCLLCADVSEKWLASHSQDLAA